MFAWLRNLLQQFAGSGSKIVPSEDHDEAEYEKFHNKKQEALERVLGPMHNMVGHAVIPFFMGGAVDMYAFPNALPGTAFVTQELIKPDGTGPWPSRIGTYELIAFTRHPSPTESDRERETPSDFHKMERRFCGIFTGLANYSSMAELNPHETCEAPGGNDEPALILLDEFVPARGEFRINDRRHGLMLCIEVFPSELDFSRKHGGRELLTKLMDAGHYPYSDLDREPVA